MATETVVLHPPATTDEQVEERLNEEIKTIEHESVSLPKESGEETTKAEELPSLAAPLSKMEEKIENKLTEELPSPEVPLSKTEEKTEAKLIEESPSPAVPLSEMEEKIEDKLIEESLSQAAPLSETEENTEDKQIEELRSPEAPLSKTEEKTEDKLIEESPSPAVPLSKTEEKAEDKLIEDSPSPAAPLSVTEEKTEDKQIEPPVPEEVVKTDDTPVPDVQVKETLEVAQYPVCEPEISTVPKAVVDVVESQPEEQLATESVEKESKEQPEMESVKIVDVPESSVEVLEKQEEPSEVSPATEPEAIVVKKREDSEAESIKEEKPEPIIPLVEEKPGEQSGVTEQDEKECEEVVPKGSVEGETVKEETALIDKVEDTTILEKEKTCEGQEVFASESSDQVVSINQEAQANLKEDEMAGMENIEKEAIGANVVQELSKEAAVEVAKVNEENEAKNLSKEGNEEKNVVTDVFTEPTKVEDVNSSIPTAEVTEKSFVGEKTSRDVELPASVEMNKDGDIEGKPDENITAVQEQVGEAQESKLEAKGEETVNADVEKLEKEKLDETPESEVPNLEPSSKIVDDTKTSQDLPKEVPAKPTQKQSNNLLTKVKKSLAKAKRAIIGQSPSSKTLSSETKGDIEVK